MDKKKIVFLALILFSFITLPIFGANNCIQVTGKVTMVGNEPFTQIAIQATSGPRGFYIATGPLVAELKNLQGATLKVQGRVTGDEPVYKAKLLEVSAYRVAAVGEGPNVKLPWVGTLAGNPLRLETENRQILALEGPLVTTLSRYVGAKLWLTGTSRSTGMFWRKRITLRPDAYGIIRNPNSR